MLDQSSVLGDRVADVVKRLLAERSIDRVFAPDDEFRKLGLSSLDMVNLVLAVEAAFDLTIPDGDITPANFRSVATVSRLVATLTRPR